MNHRDNSKSAIIYPASASAAQTHLPFSLATQVGELIFVSGQASVDKSGAIVSGTFEAEFRLSVET